MLLNELSSFWQVTYTPRSLNLLSLVASASYTPTAYDSESPGFSLLSLLRVN